MSDFGGDKKPLDTEQTSKSSVDLNADLKGLITSALGALIWQSMIAGGLYLLAPGYFLPFFNNQEVRLILLALLAWQIFGPWLIAQLPDERWRKINRNIFSSAPLTIALIAGPALTTGIGNTGVIDATSQSDVGATTDKAADTNSQAIQLKNAVLKTSTMSIQIDRALLTSSLSQFGIDSTASDSATYIVVFLTFRNEGSSAMHLHPGSPYSPGLIIGTDDGTSFSPDEDASDALRDKEGFLRELQLQPGLAKPAVVVFEIPLQQLKNNPSFFISRSTWAGKIPLYPDQSSEAAKSTVDSSQRVSIAEEEKTKSDQQDAGANATALTEPSKLETQTESIQKPTKDFSVGAGDSPISSNEITPEAAVSQLYQLHLHSSQSVFDPKSRTILDQYFDKRLADLIWKQLGQDKFDLDPLTDAQNLENPDFKVASTEINDDIAITKVNFFNFGKTSVMTFHLRKIGSSWKIADIDYENGSNLLKSLE